MNLKNCQLPPESCSFPKKQGIIALNTLNLQDFELLFLRESQSIAKPHPNYSLILVGISGLVWG